MKRFIIEIDGEFFPNPAFSYQIYLLAKTVATVKTAAIHFLNHVPNHFSKYADGGMILPNTPEYNFSIQNKAAKVSTEKLAEVLKKSISGDVRLFCNDKEIK